jgi:DNA processing protein
MTEGFFCLPPDQMTEAETLSALWLCSIPWIGATLPRELLGEFGSYEAVYRAPEQILKQFLPKSALQLFLKSRNELIPEKLKADMEASDTRLILPGDPEFPERLKYIPDPPCGLFVIGKLPDPAAYSVAIIGARDCSEYGRYVASRIGSELGRAGVSIISGMARGIDGIGQQAALDSGGYSLGILGSGTDVCYPRSNRALYARLKEQGGILSTYGPGTEAKPEYFPPRNRIVSAFADAVIVVESKTKSGTLITVDMALEQGREVYVVPGRITDRLSDGCNSLLTQGAKAFLSPELFLQELKATCDPSRFCSPVPPNPIAKKIAADRSSDSHKRIRIPDKTPTLDPDALAVYRLLNLDPQTTAELCAKLPSDFTEGQVNLLLMQLVLEDLAVQVSQGSFVRFLQ